MRTRSRSPFARTDGRPRIPQLPASIVLQGRSLVGETVTDDLRIKSLTVDEKDDATPAIRINRSNASPNSMEIYNSAGTLVAKLTAPGGLTTISAVSIFNAIADANPEFQVSHANLSLGAGGATTTDVQLGRAAADILRLGAGGTTGDAFEFWEMTAPATPSTNAVRVYASDKAGVSTLYYKDDAGTVYDLSLAAASAPNSADYLTGTAQAGLTSEIVVGTTPGGELGGTWATPTVDATHSGSAHHGAAHEVTTLGVRGILAAGVATTNVPVGTANDAILIAFTPTKDITVTKLMWWTAGAAGGNYDVGLYNNAGTKLWTKGSTASPGIGTNSVVETVTGSALTAGTRYWAAFASDSTLPTFRSVGSLFHSDMGIGDDGTQLTLVFGSSFPLPASFTLGSGTAGTKVFFASMRSA